MSKLVQQHGLKNGDLRREYGRKDKMYVSKENFVIGSTSSQKTLKEPKTLKIDSSVMAGRRPQHEQHGPQRKHHEESMSAYNANNTSSQNEDGKQNQNAETHDTFNRNTEAPQTVYAYSKLSQVYLGGARTSNHGQSPFQNQSQKQPKSKKFEYGHGARRGSPKALTGNDSYELAKNSNQDMAFPSHPGAVLAAGKKQPIKNANGTALSSMLRHGPQTSKISITDQMASTPDQIGAGDAVQGDAPSWTELPAVMKSNEGYSEVIELMPQSPRQAALKDHTQNQARDPAGTSAQQRPEESPYFQQIERARLEPLKERINVRAKGRPAYPGKQSEKTAKRTLETLSKQALSRSNLADSIEREQQAKRISNNTVERTAAPVPKLSLPDVYRRPQRIKGPANQGSVPASNGHNLNGRQVQEQENGGAPVGAARRSIQKSQALIQQKFNHLNLRADPGPPPGPKAGAVGSHTHGSTGTNGRFKSSIKKSYKNQQSAVVEEDPGLAAAASQDNYQTLNPNVQSSGKLPSLPNQSSELNRQHGSHKKPFESILDQINRASDDNDRQAHNLKRQSSQSRQASLVNLRNPESVLPRPATLSSAGADHESLHRSPNATDQAKANRTRLEKQGGSTSKNSNHENLPFAKQLKKQYEPRRRQQPGNSRKDVGSSTELAQVHGRVSEPPTGGLTDLRVGDLRVKGGLGEAPATVKSTVARGDQAGAVVDDALDPKDQELASQRGHTKSKSSAAPKLFPNAQMSVKRIMVHDAEDDGRESRESDVIQAGRDSGVRSRVNNSSLKHMQTDPTIGAAKPWKDRQLTNASRPGATKKSPSPLGAQLVLSQQRSVKKALKVMAGTEVMNSQRNILVKPTQIKYGQEAPAPKGSGDYQASPGLPDVDSGRKGKVHGSTDARISRRGNKIRSSSHKDEALQAGGVSDAIITKDLLLKEQADHKENKEGVEPARRQGSVTEQRLSARKRLTAEVTREPSEQREQPRHRSNQPGAPKVAVRLAGNSPQKKELNSYGQSKRQSSMAFKEGLGGKNRVTRSRDNQAQPRGSGLNVNRSSTMALAHNGSQTGINGVTSRMAQQGKEHFLRLLEEYNQWRREADRNAEPSAPTPKQLFQVHDFQIGLQIGQGSFACVKRSVHRKTNHVIALKIYEKKNLQQESASLALHREIYVLANLRHPNIMRLYEVVDSRTHVHLVMELCVGKNLYHSLKKRKPLQRFSEPEAAHIFRQIISAVAYMHELNVVHRDLKLDNILINEQNGNEIKIIDFGFATGCSKDEKLTMQCGTPQYMCPDLAKKQHYQGQAADVWACGVILYILVVGKLPFFAEYEGDLFRKIQNAKYKFPDDADEEGRAVSQGVKNLIIRIFNKDPSKRLTAAQVLEDPWLKRYSNGSEGLLEPADDKAEKAENPAGEQVEKETAEKA